MRNALIFLQMLLIPLIAHASPPEALECAATFDARLADAQQAIATQALYMAEWGRVMPWFDQHCRLLSELERAIRKLDDPAAFVCDTRKGRPRELTSAFVVAHPDPVDVVIFQDLSHEDDVCALYDAAERVSLVLREPTPQQKLAVLCYASERPSCLSVRGKLAVRGPVP